VFFGGDQLSISTPEKIEAAGGMAKDAIFKTSSLSIIFIIFWVVAVYSVVYFINRNLKRINRFIDSSVKKLDYLPRFLDVKDSKNEPEARHNRGAQNNNPVIAEKKCNEYGHDVRRENASSDFFFSHF
jgi:hypothetical protein